MDASIEDVAPVGVLESFILDQSSPTPETKDNGQLNNNNFLVLQKRLEEQGNEIQELKNENKQLKNQLNEAFQNIISIYNKLSKFNKLDNCLNKINEFDLNFLYNRLDNKLYKLEDSYKSLNHELIKTRGELGLINSGIKHILNKSISKCILKYKASVDGKSSDIFHLKCDNIFYKLFIIKTTNERRFGVFFNGRQNNKNNNKNNNNMENISPFTSYRSNEINIPNNFFSTINSLENFMTDNFSMDYINNNDFDKNEIFTCQFHPEKFFIFSLNRVKLYYPQPNNASKMPCFSINFDPNRESYYGKEKKININNQIKEYVLSGKEEFNILEFEVYEIEIEK